MMAVLMGVLLRDSIVITVLLAMPGCQRAEVISLGELQQSSSASPMQVRNRGCDPQCQASFPRIIADAESFEGQRLVVGGYLALNEGLLSLYAHEEDFRSGVGDPDALLLRAPQSLQMEIADRYLYKYVFITGTYSQEYVGARTLRLGSLSGVIVVTDALKRNAREEAKDLRFVLEDMDVITSPP